MFKNLLASIGDKVKATNEDTTIENDNAIAVSLNNVPDIPSIKISGKNQHPIVKLAENHKVKLQNEIELYFEQKPKSIIIGITGTNGKSTLASLISHILSDNKIKNIICGIFGNLACLVNPNKKNIFISLYNEQSKKLYLFDEKLFPVSNFPKKISGNAVTKFSKNNFYYSFLEDNNSVSLNFVSIQ